MSIKALNWAMHQVRTDGPSAQAVLFVVADVANASGVSCHADPDYIAERSRQSRATVFRRIQELVWAGAIARDVKVMPDGRRSYKITLMLEKSIDYDGKQVEAWRKAHAQNEPIEESQIETQPQSQIETPIISPVRQQASHSCDLQEESKGLQESPPTPKGEWAHEKSWRKFEEAWVEPILHQRLCRDLWGKLTDAERELVTVAAGGYVACRLAQRRPPPVCNAQKFLREPAAWPSYAARAPNAGGAAAVPTTSVPIQSPEGRAHAALCRVAHATPLEIGGAYRRRTPLSARGLALAEAPPEEAWIFIAAEQRRQCAAWGEFLANELPGVNRPTLVWDRNPGHRVGFFAPWPWPPKSDGTIYHPGTDPPSSGERVEGMIATTEEDLQEFTR